MNKLTADQKRTQADQLIYEAAHLYNKGVRKNRYLRWTPAQRKRVVQIFFNLRKLGVSTKPLHDIGFAPGAVYEWIGKHGTDKQKGKIKKYYSKKARAAIAETFGQPSEEVHAKLVTPNFDLEAVAPGQAPVDAVFEAQPVHDDAVVCSNCPCTPTPPAPTKEAGPGREVGKPGFFRKVLDFITG